MASKEELKTAKRMTTISAIKTSSFSVRGDKKDGMKFGTKTKYDP